MQLCETMLVMNRSALPNSAEHLDLIHYPTLSNSRAMIIHGAQSSSVPLIREWIVTLDLVSFHSVLEKSSGQLLGLIVMSH
jgi:hypothetical protein